MRHEFKKNGKIVDELLIFFLKKGHHEVRFDIKYTKEQTDFTIFLENISQDEKALIDECFSQTRDESMEEYGWELMGECELSAELNMVGMCIDAHHIEEEGNIMMIHLTRKH